MRLLEEVVRETKDQSVSFLDQSRVMRFFHLKGTIDYDWKEFRIPLLKGIVLLLLGTTQLG